MLLELVLALQAAPEVASTRHCTGARRGEVCTEAGRETLRRELGVRTVEDEVADGVEIYRAFYLEGGGGLPAVAFVRRPGRNPSVEVSGGGGQVMTADVPLTVWRQVQAAGALVGETPTPVRAAAAPPPTGSGQETRLDDICMDGGAVLAETGIPAPNPRAAAEVRSQAVSNCAASGAHAFVRQLAALAVPAFPGCAAMETDGEPEGVRTLHLCFRLTGDQVAAAEVWRRAQVEPYLRDDDSQGRRRLEWRRATGVDPWTRLIWEGEAVPPNPGGRDAGGAADFLIAKTAETPSLRFHPVGFRGVSASTVEVEGQATMSLDEPSGRYRHAAYQQTWTRASGGEWRVARWTVEPFVSQP